MEIAGDETTILADCNHINFIIGMHNGWRLSLGIIIRLLSGSCTTFAFRVLIPSVPPPDHVARVNYDVTERDATP